MSKPVTPTPLTQQNRLAIRGLLDKHFDDGTGQYLDGMSDDKIATTLNVPRVHVEAIREAAYGAIRVNPEVAAIKAEIAQARQALSVAQKAITDQASRLDALDKRLAKIAA